MKLGQIYQQVIKTGIESDIRPQCEIAALLKKRRQQYQGLDAKKKEFFDMDSLENPFADTRIIWGDPKSDVKSMIVGIDVEGPELLVAQQLRQQGVAIDLVVAHHPEGKAYANFYDVMDLQVDAYTQAGISVAVAQNLVQQRKYEIGRRLHAANHQRSADIAKLLDINFMCMHTPADNLAHQYVSQLFTKEKPKTLGQILDLLYSVPEYQDAAKNNNAPKIVLGGKDTRCSNIHIEFTGGTEGPKEIYQQLSLRGIDTIVAMHQSETHYKKCKEANINVIFASHIASDALGVNCMIDHLEKRAKHTFKIYDFSGFRRVKKRNL